MPGARAARRERRDPAQPGRPHPLEPGLEVHVGDVRHRCRAPHEVAGPWLQQRVDAEQLREIRAHGGILRSGLVEIDGARIAHVDDQFLQLAVDFGPRRCEVARPGRLGPASPTTRRAPRSSHSSLMSASICFSRRSGRPAPPSSNCHSSCCWANSRAAMTLGPARLVVCSHSVRLRIELQRPDSEWRDPSPRCATPGAARAPTGSACRRSETRARRLLTRKSAAHGLYARSSGRGETAACDGPVPAREAGAAGNVSAAEGACAAAAQARALAGPSP